MAVITIQGTNFDSYVSFADANDYMKARIGSPEWGDASFTTKLQALVTSTRWINRILQRLTDEDLIPDPADDPSPTPTPQLIKDATTEAAYALIVDSTIQNKTSATSDNNKILQAGSAKLERFRPESGTALPTIAQQLVNEWIADVGGATLTAGAAYGTDGETSFEEVDLWGRDVGYP
jgi:hypothetical protein